MRVVFVTHNELGLACLEELVALGADIEGLYTRPPEKGVADQADFRDFARECGVSLHEVASVNDAPVVEQIRDDDPELLFVVGWSHLIDSQVLEIPSVAALGMHPAPLPRGRGRAPIAWSLIKGLDETALSFFHLVEEADAGDLVGQVPIPIYRTDDAATLYDKVVDAGRDLIREYYPRFEHGEIPREPQDEELATMWPRRRPEHGLVDWNRPAEEVYNWIRGQSQPYPGAFSYLNGREIRLWSASPPENDTVYAKPGRILGTSGESLVVAAWESKIEITRIQVGSGDKVNGANLVEETDFAVGDVFTNARDVLIDS